MKKNQFIFNFIPFLLIILLFSLKVSFGQESTNKVGQSSPENPGIVSYTFRNYFPKDFAGTLDIIKKNGISDIEFSNLFGKKAEDIRTLIDARGIKCSSFGVSYDDLLKKTDTVAANAQKLGAKYVRLAWVPHKGKFTLEDARKAIDDFSRVGKVLLDKYDLHFVYHNHGYEFEPYENGTLYDYIVERTDPKYVNFELDILWSFFPGQNPAKLLQKYSSRYKCMHLKDLKKGVLGNASGGTSQDNDVILGTGQLNLPEILKAAKAAGIEHYYIEDESSTSMIQVPQSIAYLKSLKL